VINGGTLSGTITNQGTIRNSDCLPIPAFSVVRWAGRLPAMPPIKQA
jgi:hypothetical protein